MKDKTRLRHAGSGPHSLVRTVNPPIQRGSTVLMPTGASLYDGSQVGYGRAGLSAQNALCEALADMESGVGARLYPSGLAAVTGPMLALLKSGDEVLVCQHVYRPTRMFCDNLLTRYGVKVRYYPQTLPADALMALTTKRTRMIVLESPGSLTFEMQDVPGIARLARTQGVLTLMDNTWAAGWLFKPLEHDVDVSVQALTKYVGGHSDVFMGSAAVRDKALLAKLDAGMREMGWSVSPEDAYLMLRSLRTLDIRLERHGKNGLQVAEWLKKQPEVVEVIHPALPGARGHALWKRDFTGACGLFGVVLKPGSEAAVNAFLDALEVIGLGFSWGGHESLAISCDPQRQPGDYAGPLMRLHIGLEDPDDLTADLRRGLDAYNAATAP